MRFSLYPRGKVTTSPRLQADGPADKIVHNSESSPKTNGKITAANIVHDSAASPRTGTSAHSILRVPSLCTKAYDNTAPKLSVSPITRPGTDASNLDRGEPSSMEWCGVHNHKILLSPPPTWSPSRVSESVAQSHVYRPDNSIAFLAEADSWLPHPAGSSFLTRLPNTASHQPQHCNFFRPPFVAEESAYHQPQQLRSNRSQYSSPLVRSGRGALRVSTRSRHYEQPNRLLVGTTSYPVSHRGRGVVSSMACRMPLPPSDLSSSLSSTQPKILTEANVNDPLGRLHNDIVRSRTNNPNLDAGHNILRTNRVDDSTVRKSKRKLPLARKASLANAGRRD
jgi:hypothetical protein